MIVTATLLFLIETGQSSLGSQYYLAALLADVIIAGAINS
jgi:hypothetical protein